MTKDRSPRRKKNVKKGKNSGNTSRIKPADNPEANATATTIIQKHYYGDEDLI